MATSSMLRVGDRAPDISLPGTGGKTVRLADLIGKKTVVLYFYPKDETYGCTKESCSFRDNYEAFTEAGAEVVGVSADSVDSHERFASHHRLPFTLLSDTSGEARARFGVKSTLGFIPGRVTFVIDRQGVVRQVFESLVRFNDHVTNALALVRKLESEAAAAQPAT